MTLREASDALMPLVSQLRDVADRMYGTDIDRNKLAADCRRIAYDLELRARKAAVRGVALGEPEPR